MVTYNIYNSGVSNLLASLGDTLNTLQHIITKTSHNVLSKFMLFCWAAFIAILRYMQPMGHRLDTPEFHMVPKSTIQKQDVFRKT